MKTEPIAISKLPDFCRASIIYLTILACVLLATLLSLVMPNWQQNYWFNFSSFTLFSLWTALSSIGILCSIKRFFPELHLRQFSIIAVAVCVLFSLLYTTILSVYLQSDATASLLFKNGVITLIVSGIFFRYYFLQQQSLLQIQSEAEARIQALQSRIRPHFLFNSLNTLANMATQDPNKTEESILDLADIFRASMQRSDKLIPFSEEKHLCSQYLALEKQRLGEKLQVEWHTDTIDGKIPFPPLLLQPIIENAVFHGVQNRTDGGTIIIKGLSSKNHIEIEVTNPLPTTSDTLHKGNSLALRNIRQRIEVLYPGKANFTHHSSQDTFFCRLKIPKNRTEML